MVIAVISVLTGISFYAFGVLKTKARHDNARALVRSVAVAISAYQNCQLWLSLQDGGGLVRFPLWDVNRDHYLDGTPEGETATPFPALVAASGYRGFYEIVRPELPKWAMRPPNDPGAVPGRIYDPWGKALNLAFSVRAYGADGFGVWSTGPDGTGRFDAWNADEFEARKYDKAWMAAHPGMDNIVSWEAK